jgi:hypothetical protein
MEQFDYILILDMAAIALFAVIMSLSARLGEALKIKPYFRLFSVCIWLILAAAFINLIDTGSHLNVFGIIAIAMRLLSGITAVAVCLRYWSWLFAEFIPKQGHPQ